MREIVKIGDAFVVRGMSLNEYADLINSHNCTSVVLVREINTYQELQEMLDELSEINNYCDPIWDFPLDELQEREKEDYDYFFVELQDDEGDDRYFETYIPITQIKEVL